MKRCPPGPRTSPQPVEMTKSRVTWCRGEEGGGAGFIKEHTKGDLGKHQHVLYVFLFAPGGVR